jgi:integrase
MPDNGPAWRTAFRSTGQIVRHRVGTLSVIPPEHCPPSLRNRVRHAPVRAHYDHRFGVAAIQAGIPLNLLQRCLGHAQLTTTAIYANAVGPEERNIAARMWT